VVGCGPLSCGKHEKARVLHVAGLCGRFADRKGGELSDAAGAIDSAFRVRRRDRHRRAPDRPIFVGETKPDLHHRESARRRRQSWHRDGRALAPDGYTLALVGAPSAINATLYDKLSFNFIRDIAPVAAIVRFPNVMVVNPSVPAESLPDFIAYAKANPGKLNMASPGSGSTPHVTGELFKMMTGVDMVHVPYRSVAAVMTDLLVGRVHVYFGTTASSIEYIRAGKLRALAVTTAMRSQTLPDIPTVAEFVPGYEASAWFGVGAPRNTSAEVVDRLNTEINASLGDPKLKARLMDLGGIALTGSPADFTRLIAEETVKWAKFSGAKAE
jgi:tripartite-type tricarboxylate transporter receptor subunit TctC